MRGAFDWIARMVIVALSVVATLSIIGSIAAIPSGSIEGRLGIDERRSYAEPDLRSEEARAPDLLERSEAEPGGAMRGAGATTTPPPLPDPLERWLESITYALIAIAALLAAVVFLLWRALRLAEATARRD